jgi:MraZ protein
VTENPESRASGEPDASNEAAGGGPETWDDLQVGFCGNPRAKLDERGRLKMPADFKAFIERKYGKDFNAFYITSRDGLDAEIYPMPEWQRHLAKVFKMPASSQARKSLLARYNLYGDRADMDPQGRLLFPEELRASGLVNEDVKVSGEGILLRVTSVKSLRESVQGKPMPAQEVDELTEYGL